MASVASPTNLPGIDLVALAKGMGCDGVRVTGPKDLRDALARALRSPVPILVDVEIE